MFRYSHRTLIILSGLVWLFVGIFLLSLGVQFLSCSLDDQSGFSILTLLTEKRGWSFETSFVAILTSGLVIGYIKGRFALAKSVKRQIRRILSLPNPASLAKIYGLGYYILLACMMGLGFLMRFLPITLDTRGAVDTIIGAALINGALLYFRFALLPPAILKTRMKQEEVIRDS